MEMRFNTMGMIVGLALLVLPAMAFGQECESDADCSDGDVCITPPCVTLAMDCAPGEECEEIQCDEIGECGNKYGIPEEALCDTSADCPAYFECMEREFGCKGGPTSPPTTIGGGGDDSKGSSGSSGSASSGSTPDSGDVDDPDGDSDEDPEESSQIMPMPEDEGGEDGDEDGDEEECEPEKISLCVFMPTDCESDEECDDGFSCQVTQEVCSGGGGGSIGIGGVGSCVCAECICEEGDDECECPPCDCDEDSFAPVPSEEGGDDDPAEESGDEDPLPPIEEECEVVAQQCMPEEISCATDDECPDGWECVEGPTNSTGISMDCPPCACEEGEEDCDCPDCEEGMIDPEPVETEGMCLPGGWMELAESLGGGGGWDEENTTTLGGGSGGGNEGPGKGSPPANPSDDGQSSGGSSGGCSVAAAGGSMGTGLMLMSILFGLLVPGLRRRRNS